MLTPPCAGSVHRDHRDVHCPLAGEPSGYWSPVGRRGLVGQSTRRASGGPRRCAVHAEISCRIQGDLSKIRDLDGLIIRVGLCHSLVTHLGSRWCKSQFPLYLRPKTLQSTFPTSWCEWGYPWCSHRPPASFSGNLIAVDAIQEKFTCTRLIIETTTRAIHYTREIAKNIEFVFFKFDRVC